MKFYIHMSSRLKKSRHQVIGSPVLSDRQEHKHAVHLQYTDDGLQPTSRPTHRPTVTTPIKTNNHKKQDDVQEQKLLEKMLDVWITNQSSCISFPMKRVIQLARVILHKPMIILAEENGLIIDPADVVEEQLKFVFEELQDSAIMCNMCNFRTLQWFHKCVILDQNSVVEQDDTNKLLTNPRSELVLKMQQIDSRKVRL